MTNQKFKLIVASIAAILAEAVVPVFMAPVAEAAPQFTQMYVRLDRHAELVATGGTVCATPTAASTPTPAGDEAQVLVTFPTQTVGTDFVVNSTAANWTVTTSNLPAGATAWPGIGTATNVTGKTVTFPSNNLAAATFYCFNFSGTNTLTNGSAGASSGIVNATMRTQTSGNADINQTNWATGLITNDQITVTAVVPPNFTIALDGNSDTFPANLDPAVISVTGGRTVTITTNAKSGWIAWVKDSDQGLYSATANYKINTSGTVDGAPSTLVANNEGYALDVDITTDAAGGCTVAVDAEYDGSGATQGGTLSGNFQPIAACTGTPPAASDGDVLTLKELATIRGSTVAGSDYTDILTVVGAGNF